MNLATQVSRLSKAKSKLGDLFAISRHTVMDAGTTQTRVMAIVSESFPQGPRHCRSELMGFSDALMHQAIVASRVKGTPHAA